MAVFLRMTCPPLMASVMGMVVELPGPAAVHGIVLGVVLPSLKLRAAPYKREQHGARLACLHELPAQRRLHGQQFSVRHYLVLPAQGLSLLRLHLAPAQGLSESLLAHLRLPPQGLPAHGAEACLAGASAALAAGATGRPSKATAKAAAIEAVFLRTGCMS